MYVNEQDSALAVLRTNGADLTAGSSHEDECFGLLQHASKAEGLCAELGHHKRTDTSRRLDKSGFDIEQLNF